MSTDLGHDDSSGASAAPVGPQEVREGCWMVGHRNPVALLQCNTYLRTFTKGETSTHVCVDPGSPLDFPVVEANINELIGDLSELSALSINHQDPDVAGNATFMCRANPDVSMLVSEETWRLVRHLFIEPRRVRFANESRSQRMTIDSESSWKLVPTPYCHFRGAMAFYDPELRVLFSGDLFGGVNRVGQVRLLAVEDDWPGIAQFHQIYMPTRDALRYAVRQIRALQPPVEVIAPQHGYVITGDLVPLFLQRMYDLSVGMDLLPVELDEQYLPGYRAVAAQLIAQAAATIGHDEVFRRLTDKQDDDGLEQYVKVVRMEVQVEHEGYLAVVKILNRICRGQSLELANTLRSDVLTACFERGLPIPPVGVGIEMDVGAG